MIKAIFIDYTGTIIQEKGADLEKIVSRILKYSRLETDGREKLWRCFFDRR